MTVKIKVSYLLFLLLISFYNWIDCAEYTTEESCETKDKRSGICIAVPHCEYAVNLIAKEMKKAVRIFLDANRCGFEGLQPKVCCPRQQNDQSRIVSSEQNPSLLLPKDCGLVDVSLPSRIYGGEETELGEFPWMALLEYQNYNGYEMEWILGCGGSLITKRYVLTAAHCIPAAKLSRQLKRVRLGEHDTRTDPDCNGRTCADRLVLVTIERAIRHEDYTITRLGYDIGLLRLSREVKFTRFVRPICLPDQEVFHGIFWAAGWGRIDNRTLSSVKRKVSLPYVDNHQCADTYRAKIRDGQMCAGGIEGKDTCVGDSGGPLMNEVNQASGPKRWVAHGVVSFGATPCGQPGWPGVYSKVYYFERWILSHLSP